jgi:hypothetical protein
MGVGPWDSLWGLGKSAKKQPPVLQLQPTPDWAAAEASCLLPRPSQVPPPLMETNPSHEWPTKALEWP